MTEKQEPAFLGYDIIYKIFVRACAKTVGIGRMVSRYLSARLKETLFANNLDEKLQTKPLLLSIEWKRNQSKSQKLLEFKRNQVKVSGDKGFWTLEIHSCNHIAQDKRQKLLEFKGWGSNQVQVSSDKGFLCIVENINQVFLVNPTIQMAISLPHLEESTVDKTFLSRSCFVCRTSESWKVLSVVIYSHEERWTEDYHLLESGDCSWKIMKKAENLGHYYPAEGIHSLCIHGKDSLRLCYGATSEEGSEYMMVFDFISQALIPHALPLVLNQNSHPVNFWFDSAVANSQGTPAIAKRIVSNGVLHLWKLVSSGNTAWIEQLISTTPLEEGFHSPMVFFVGSTTDGEFLIFNVHDIDNFKQYVGYYNLGEETFQRYLKTYSTLKDRVIWNHLETLQNL